MATRKNKGLLLSVLFRINLG